MLPAIPDRCHRYLLDTRDPLRTQREMDFYRMVLAFDDERASQVIFRHDFVDPADLSCLGKKRSALVP